MKLIQAPIDNKNILEDFTDIFHSGDYVESRDDDFVKQVYFIDNKLFEINYRYGLNGFCIKCWDIMDNMQIVYEIREKVESMNMDNVIVKYYDTDYDGQYELNAGFYFVES